MSSEPPNVCRRSARLAAKRAETARKDEAGATLSKPEVKAEGSGCLSAVTKRKATSKTTRAARPEKKLKTVQEAGDGKTPNTRTKGQDVAQRVTCDREGAAMSSGDPERPKKAGKATALAKTSSMQEEAVATAPRTTKRRRTRAELPPDEPSKQAKRICRESSATSCSSAASETSSSGSYRTAEEDSVSVTAHTMPGTREQEHDKVPTPPVEAGTKFDRLRRVWRWLVALEGDHSGGQNSES